MVKAINADYCYPFNAFLYSNETTKALVGGYCCTLINVCFLFVVGFRSRAGCSWPRLPTLYTTFSTQNSGTRSLYHKINNIEVPVSYFYMLLLWIWQMRHFIFQACISSVSFKDVWKFPLRAIKVYYPFTLWMCLWFVCAYLRTWLACVSAG